MGKWEELSHLMAVNVSTMLNQLTTTTTTKNQMDICAKIGNKIARCLSIFFYNTACHPYFPKSFSLIMSVDTLQACVAMCLFTSRCCIIFFISVLNRSAPNVLHFQNLLILIRWVLTNYFVYSVYLIHTSINVFLLRNLCISHKLLWEDGLPKHQTWCEIKHLNRTKLARWDHWD